ncbi:MAG: lysophospholipase [Saprospiraceae bacterium]|nr:lysophospholipase [Saprospiraceae bacterium]MCF8251435.1 lysophospholipase [Saprospiraceae bacterium]MCF8282563.1 lysophospholipase [Bacteroidales bacterium]MCF8313030.1 lysophospholipase [Saprospiraceae bacterium]MCF8441477.1 lysophospholipase [Saprospiraceae bacterium]
MKWLKGIVIVLFSLYALVCGGLYFAQERLIFHPDKLNEDYAFREGEEVELPVAKGISLNCLWMKEPASRGVILYLHGNKGSNRRCYHQAQSMAGNSYDIFMPDYRGFGKSDGEIDSEKQLFSDVQAAYDFLKKHYREDQIVVVGYSIGSGMASYLAANNHPQQLVLLAPYTSVVDLKNGMAPFLPDFLLKYPLRNYAFLQNVKFPVTLFHGEFDKVIPFSSSEKLQAINPNLFRLVKLSEGHRGVIFSPVFKETVRNLLE